MEVSTRTHVQRVYAQTFDADKFHKLIDLHLSARLYPGFLFLISSFHVQLLVSSFMNICQSAVLHNIYGNQLPP